MTYSKFGKFFRNQTLLLLLSDIVAYQRNDQTYVY